MKEDILEQAVDDWFLSMPATFTKHNVKYRPEKGVDGYNSKQDSVNSDIDVLAVHTNKKDAESVSVASCKSWQEGFNPKKTLDALLNTPEKVWGARPVWKGFRELSKKKWGKALADKVFSETNSKDFTYYLAVTKLVVNRNEDLAEAIHKFENCEYFLDNLKYNQSSKVRIKLLTFKEIFYNYIENRNTTTLEATELGRLLQILRAADIKLEQE